MTAMLLLLLLVSPFQAAAILNVGAGSSGYSISLFYGVEAAFVLVAVLCTRTETWRILHRRDGVHTLATFWVVCTLSVLIGSALFSGVSVYTPQLGIDAQFYQQTPLRFNLYMVGQIVYLSLHVAAYFVVCKVPRPSSAALHRCIVGMALIVTAFACWQLLHKEVGLYYPSSIIYRATGHLGNDETLGRVDRLSATFMEPSFYGLYAAALATYFLFCIRKLWSTDGFVHLLLAVQCVMSTSSTGIVSLVFGYLLYASVRLVRAKRRDVRVLLAASFIAAVAAAVVAVVFGRYVNEVLQAEIFNKVSTLSYIHRHASNVFAWKLFVDTFGLGVGLGGNRPSSLALYLLSDVGAVGTILFAAFAFRVLRRRLPEAVSLDLSDRYSAARAALVVTLVGMVVAAPDLSTPQLWLWFFIVVAFARAGERAAYVRAEGSERFGRGLAFGVRREWVRTGRAR